MADGEPEKKTIQDSVPVGSDEDGIDTIPAEEFATAELANSDPRNKSFAPLPQPNPFAHLGQPRPTATITTNASLAAQPPLGKLPSATPEPNIPSFLVGFSEATQSRMKALFQGSDLLPTEPTKSKLPEFLISLQRTTDSKIKALLESSERLQRATGSHIQAFLQGPKEETEEDQFINNLPESEWLPADGESAAAFPSPNEPTIWTLPESKLTQQERKIKKEYLTKAGPKSEPLRPNKTLQGTKPSWIAAQRRMLVTAAVTIFLVFFGWQIGHSSVAQQFERAGIEQLSKGDPDDALTNFDRAIQVDGRSASAYLNRGNAHRKKGELTKAFDDYSTALKLSPKSVSMLDSRATLCLQLENYAQAANDYSVILGFAPEEMKPQMYNNRAAAYAALGQYDKALQDYGAAVKANPKDLQALNGSAHCLQQLGRYARAASEYNLALTLDPQDIDAYLGCGYCSLKQKNFVEAAKDFQKVLQQDPLNKLALCYRAALYADQGLSAKALEDLSDVVQLDPKYAPALSARAMLYSNKGDYAKAIKDYDQAEQIPQFKGRLALCLARASVYRKMKEYEKAAADYSKVIGLAPNDYLPYLSRAQCYQQLKEYRKAIDDCTAAAKLSPGSADIYQQRGTMHEQFGNSMSAYKDYSLAISLDNKKIEPYISRGRSSLAKRDFAAALADFDRALEIDSKNADALAGRIQTVAANSVPKLPVVPANDAPKLAVAAASNSLDLSKVSAANLIKNGYSRLQQGAADEAILMLSEAVRRDPNDSTARRYLAYAMLRADRRSEATEQFEALRQLKALLPADEQALQKASKQSGDQQHITPTLTLAQYQAKLAANPADLDSIYCVAVLFAKSGMTSYALLECEDGINRAPPKSEAHQRFEGFYNFLKNKK